MRNLRDDMTADLTRTFLQDDHFGETVTLDREGKESIQVAIAVAGDGDLRDATVGGGREVIQELMVDFPRVYAYTEDVPPRPLAYRPELNDSFVWSATGERYAFTGETIEADSFWQKLRFRRRHTFTIGGQQSSGAGK